MATIVSMFDESGNALRPWAVLGHICHAFDITNTYRVENVGTAGGMIVYHPADFTRAQDVAFIVGLKPALVMGWPPCTDLAVSGTRSFVAKFAADPLFQHKAMALARTVEAVGIITGAPWFAENPIGVLSTMWRKPDHYFDPCDYGGYLPLDDVHPRWPDYIPPPRCLYEAHMSVGGQRFHRP